MIKTKKTIKKIVKIKATLKLLSQYYTAEGKTVAETLNKLQPGIAKTMGVLTLEKGDLKRERIIQPGIVMGLWGKRSPTMQLVAMKNITALFSDFDAN